MKAAIRRRIENLRQRLAPSASPDELSRWGDIVAWRAGDNSPELARRLGPWGPGLNLDRYLPKAGRPACWPLRLRVALPLVIDELLSEMTPTELKTAAGLARALKETAAVILATDWPPIIERETTCGDGSRHIVIVQPDGRQEHYTIYAAGRVIRLGEWSNGRHEERELSQCELDSILADCIRG